MAKIPDPIERIVSSHPTRWTEKMLPDMQPRLGPDAPSDSTPPDRRTALPGGIKGEGEISR